MLIYVFQTLYIYVNNDFQLGSTFAHKQFVNESEKSDNYLYQLSFQISDKVTKKI